MWSVTQAFGTKQKDFFLVYIKNILLGQFIFHLFANLRHIIFKLNIQYFTSKRHPFSYWVALLLIFHNLKTGLHYHESSEGFLCGVSCMMASAKCILIIHNVILHPVGLMSTLTSSDLPF